ncbi:NUDIX domain-containing protein [Kitasatospora sp. NPDC059327]|uniref:NUDIX domain-containing protein n=1 Tax=Kitasatospora sp. NPDC059327 TaxID=3346803 RepID=UPI0036A18118
MATGSVQRVETMVKEPTASSFVFRGTPQGWVLALVWHPRLECLMLAGGHVEDFEHPGEAAVREILEETGWVARLLPGPGAALPAGAPHAGVPVPWWVVEFPVSPDNHTGERHVHVDHLFLALAEGDGPVQEPVHEVRWLSEAEVAQDPEVADDLRVYAKELFRFVALLKA